MPRYFFNIYREGSTCADLTGQEFADDKAAKQHAEDIVRDFADNNSLETVGGSVGWVEAVDEKQRPVVRLPIDEIAAGKSTCSGTA